MKPSLKDVLRESHIAVVVIVVLLGQGVLRLVQLLLLSATNAVDFLTEAFRYPYFHASYKSIPNFQSFSLLIFAALPFFAVAWILSTWMFAAGPFQAVITYVANLRRSDD